MRNWKIPGIFIVLLIIAVAFRWGTISTSTNNEAVLKTLTDRWNGTVWQESIKNGSYDKKIVSPSWFESMRKPIEKTEQYTETTIPRLLPNESLGDWFSKEIKTTKTRTVQVPPKTIYWLSSDGLVKIWGYLMLINVIWFTYAVIKSKVFKDVVIKQTTSNS